MSRAQGWMSAFGLCDVYIGVDGGAEGSDGGRRKRLHG